MAKEKRKIGEAFKPAPQFKTLYYIYFLALLIFGVLLWLLPIFIFVPPIISLSLFVIIAPFVIFTFYWIPKYYGSMTYRLTGNEMEWRRGVWFRNTGIVPYNRITNVDITQGPISEVPGIAALKIQTAGYSSPNTRSSEIKIEGVEDFEELRETIMGFVRGRKPVAVENYDEGAKGSGDRVLDELVKIRKLLDKKR